MVNNYQKINTNSSRRSSLSRFNLSLYFTLKVCILLFGLLSVCCCTQESREIKEIRHLSGKRINFNMPMWTITADTVIHNADKALSAPVKLVTYLGNNSCTECMFKIMDAWNMISDSLNISTELITVVYPDSIENIQSLLKKMHLKNTLLYDVENKYLKENGLDKVLARNRTLLLDKDNRVLLVGEPFNRHSLIDLIKKTTIAITDNGGKLPIHQDTD